MTIQEKITELENIDGWYFINFTGIGSFKGYEITLKVENCEFKKSKIQTFEEAINILHEQFMVLK